MRADNVLLLFTFCQADDDISVICDDVTGSVGKEVNLTCSVSLQITDCCIVMLKYYESFEDSVICKNWFPRDSCEQRNSFTCHYTPTTATTQFRLFVQTQCGIKTAEFIVDLTEILKHEADPEAPGEILEADPEKDHGAKINAIIPGVIGFIFIIIFIGSIVIICVKRLKNSNASGSQNRYERGASEEQTVMTTNV